MSTPAHAGRMLLVNLSVADLERSKTFFASLGFTYHPGFTGETAACTLVVGEQASVMLLSSDRFTRFCHLPVGDPATHALALFRFGRVLPATRSTPSPPPRSLRAPTKRTAPRTTASCTRSFFDLDGHGWQVM